MGRTIVSEDGCFEWDEDKAITSEKKHGIAFERALSVFCDPKRIEFHDERHSEYEDRYLTIGNASRSTLFLVIVSSTERNKRIRLISVRRASKYEEGLYYGG
ncbi:MAG: BrnT family toxin [Spirochaetia bacterium]|nr:BrnT family toxin [Spirochaetia bacterium]